MKVRTAKHPNKISGCHSPQYRICNTGTYVSSKAFSHRSCRVMRPRGHANLASPQRDRIPKPTTLHLGDQPNEPVGAGNLGRTPLENFGRLRLTLNEVGDY